MNQSRRWARPKIQLWVSLLEQEQISAALLLGCATWEPKKLGENVERLETVLRRFSGEKPEPPEEWEPPSLERVLKHMPPAQRELINRN